MESIAQSDNDAYSYTIKILHNLAAAQLLIFNKHTYRISDLSWRKQFYIKCTKKKKLNARQSIMEE